MNYGTTTTSTHTTTTYTTGADGTGCLPTDVFTLSMLPNIAQINDPNS